MTIALIVILVFSIIAVIATLYMFITLIRDKVPYVPTPDWVIEWLVANVQIPENATVIDLGCGDGRVLRALKKANPSIHAIGYEHNWFPLLFAWWRNRGKDIDIRRESFYNADLAEADVIYCYLLNSLMNKVRDTALSTLRPGARIYSYAFRIPGLTPITESAHPHNPKHTSRIFLYTVESSRQTAYT